ncbi:MAG: hypothetical protein QM730_29810 [Anaerolineales bacterium]
MIILSVVLLLFLSFFWTSPITPAASLKPVDVHSPILDIFKLLIISVGLPYFILASNGPLMQAWFSQIYPNRSYARLYSLSNVGSLFGLLTYPIFVEPNLSLRWQGWAWAGGFFLFGIVAGWVGVRSGRSSVQTTPEIESIRSAERPSFSLFTLWIALSATASLFLLSVTNQISQEVAVIPFLWIVPLTLYLLSFILTFSGERGYHRKAYSALFILSSALTLFVMLNATSLHVYWQILAYCLLLFSACMLCHGELYRLHPPAEHLTTFYLMVSIGGIFVSLIAPLIFSGYWEFFVGWAMASAVLLTILRNNTNVRARAHFAYVTFLLVTVMLSLLGTFFSGALFSKRNFYGVIRVRMDMVGSRLSPPTSWRMALPCMDWNLFPPNGATCPRHIMCRMAARGWRS